MGKINYGRVLLCGLLAGVVLNIGEFVFNELIIGSKWEEAMGSLNMEPVLIAITAYDKPEIKKQVLEYDVEEFMVKPLNIEESIGKILKHTSYY